MRKFFIFFAAGLLFVACAKNNGSSTSEAANEDVITEEEFDEEVYDDGEGPNLVADRVLISGLHYNLYDNKTAEIVYATTPTSRISEDVYIPCSVVYDNEEYRVTRIGSSAFFGCHNLRSIMIPTCIRSIGDKAFFLCSSLTSITIPESVKRIGYNPFGECRYLEIDYEGDDYSVYVDFPEDDEYVRIERDDYHYELHLYEYVITEIDSIGVVTLKWLDKNEQPQERVVDPYKMRNLVSGILVDKFENTMSGRYQLAIYIDNTIDTKGPVFQEVVKQYLEAVKMLREKESLVLFSKEYASLSYEQRMEINYRCPKKIVGGSILPPVEDDVETDVIEEVEIEMTEYPDEPEDIIFYSVDEMPEFPGGTQAMYDYLGENLKYPEIAQEDGIQGRVVCQFTVEKDGSLSDIEVVRSAGDASLDKEAVRVIKSMPKWKPGKQRNQLVRVKFTVPVNFKLQ